jgi:cytochrome d ubiquinol oxidase subunit I
MDPVSLSRIQFCLTIMFHYIFPPLTIGMSVVMVYLEWRWLRTRQSIYGEAARFWTRIFAVNFAMGVASGIVMEFQFGTNWAAYSRFVGDVFGSALAAEGIFAFFLESGFLAVLVFGWNRVGQRMHFFSTCMVSLGSIFSSIWIVVANSWQQTPAGHHIVPILRNGVPLVIGGVPVLRAEITDFWSMVFNPSSLHRLIHVWLGCFIMGAFFIMSISAWYLLRGRHREFAERSFRGALALATISSLAALVSGHFQARAVYRHQPAKMAAFEAHFQTGPADLSLFGIPDEAGERLRDALSIPGGLSFLLHDNFKAPVTGLDRFRPEDRPPLEISFTSYHLMVALGMFFIAITLLACFFAWRGSLFSQRWLLWIFVFAILGAVAANETGWVAAEAGRQPWSVYPPIPRDPAGGLLTGADGVVHYDETLGLRTANAVSPILTEGQVTASIALFGVIYLLLFAMWIIVLNDKIQKGPEPLGTGPPEEAKGQGFLETAARRPAHVVSTTDARDDARGAATGKS